MKTHPDGQMVMKLCGDQMVMSFQLCDGQMVISFVMVHVTTSHSAVLLIHWLWNLF